MARGISSIIIEQIDEQYAPPSQDVLVLSRVGDAVFISIGEEDGSFDSTSVINETTVAVNATLLLQALYALQASEEVTG